MGVGFSFAFQTVPLSVPTNHNADGVPGGKLSAFVQPNTLYLPAYQRDLFY